MDSNLTVHKINASRYNLKKYLQGEWDVSTIIDYSDVEIEKLCLARKCHCRSESNPISVKKKT